VEARTRTTGTVYRDEAAELMAAAAREAAGPQRTGAAGQPRRPAVPYIEPERRRPMPYPEPVGVNDNPDDDVSDRPRRRISIPRLIARILIAPLYLAVALAAVAVIALFAKSFIGF
jgi:hypothetical protein